MSKFTLSLSDPNTLLPHRAGIAGLALALSDINPENALIKPDISENAVSLSWECSDKEALEWLMQQTYQIQDGLLVVRSLNLSPQGKHAFSQGVISTFLQHSKQRTLEKTPALIPIVVEENQPEIILSCRKLIDCYYLRELKGVFNSKGKFNSTISIKGHHLPGLVECFVNGEYQESPTGFIALLFLPLACSYYLMMNGRYALVIPEVTNLIAWITRRQQQGSRSYKDFRSPSAGEAGLRLLLEEQTISDLNRHKVKYCEVYQLGKQPWDMQQTGLKQAVYRIHASDDLLAIYQSAVVLFPANVRVTDRGQSWLALSKVLPWIAENLVAGRAWYSGFYEFRKANEIYERKGLVSMTENFLQQHERNLFEAVQGAFRVYLSGQNKQAKRQGRPLDYGQVTDKVIYRLQSPNTQQEFAKALVDFLSQFRSKYARGVGKEIYAWIHGAEWRKARDLSLLAIATYQGKGQNGTSDTTDADAINITPEAETETEEYVESL
ncbi:type I-MYXAN CRISPR-associated Cas8a1/Cmx1 [Nostoc minutum NIES-26]|uniref:Type I-MYXAN CRISPR-associated Cas8a1/Cmx1 n=1 Tax=Nostoc minutum NIES-26 TaxID=1844469 RepID=A0A367QTW1_9NOSO|nr:type I-MYXAN CRISPR-associated Cas8a1/Cmx1 [Nostoc minutum NIES-26]